MKSSKFILLLVVALVMANCENPSTQGTESEVPGPENREYYQLKVYTFDSDEQVKTTDEYLKTAYLPGVHRQGIENIGVFKQRMQEDDSVQRTFVHVPFSSLEQLAELEDSLLEDEEYLAAGSDYINAPHDQPPYNRFESIVLRAFEGMPKMQVPSLTSPRADRVYELRSYESATDAIHRKKVEMFNVGGEIELFTKLEFNAVFYAQVISGSKMPNLMYMTTHSEQESREEHWNQFREAPEWVEMRALPKYQNTVSHIDIYFLYPTEYSDF